MPRETLRDRVYRQKLKDSGYNEQTHPPMFEGGMNIRSVGFKDNNPFPGPGKTTGGKTVTKKKKNTRKAPKLAKPKKRKK